MTPSTLRLLRPKLLHPEIQLYCRAGRWRCKLVVLTRISYCSMPQFLKCEVYGLVLPVCLFFLAFFFLSFKKSPGYNIALPRRLFLLCSPGSSPSIRLYYKTQMRGQHQRIWVLCHHDHSFFSCFPASQANTSMNNWFPLSVWRNQRECLQWQEREYEQRIQNKCNH